MIKLAVLFTCYNRKDKTINCIQRLYSQTLDIEFDIFICDDNSPDNTAEIIKYKYPRIYIQKSSGNLFWTKGMYEVMNWAVQYDYTHFLMINDDVDFDEKMFEIIGIRGFGFCACLDIGVYILEFI